MEIDCIHFCVVDANQTLELLVAKMGLQHLGRRANEHTIEYLVGNDRLLFSIASPLNSDSPVADYLKLHPSGVKDVSFRVDDLEEIRCRISQLEIEIIARSSEDDEREWLKIQGWGAIEHTIIQASSRSYSEQIPELNETIIGVDRIVLNVAAGDLEPAVNWYRDRSCSEQIPDLHETITGIDHIVLNVAAGDLESAVNWYRELFDFEVEQTFDIHTQKSGLASKALVSCGGKIRFNINEPSSTNSQIQEFLDLNRGAGIQHIALQTNDILTSIDLMRQQAVNFLSIPQTYYANLQSRASLEQNLLLTDREWQQLERLQILMDWSTSTPEEILLQIFTKPIFESPTFFFEVIERRNRAKGFGQGNFQALFEAIEDYNASTLSV